MKKILIFLASIVICEGAGIIGSIFTAPSVDSWYRTIERPSFNPPDWVFAPVWTLLFLLMGVSLFLIWKNGVNKKNKKAIILFFIQLVFNILWSVMFFGLESPLLGFIVIVVLWIFILKTILAFRDLSKIAAWLLIPYIAWVSFAALLNLSILILNL
ncbi:MAG: tryptophan-rich sensory protein [Candidatus Portnoybacteria bacterium]|nr:tryptophan-rich sensory protein [Candidatus Portnoybacteria bacterium]